MAGRKDIEAASAFVRLYVKGTEWTKGLSLASKQLDRFAGRVGALGAKLRNTGITLAAASAPLIASVKVYADLGSELKDVSDRTGLAVDHLSELRFAADQTGSSIEDLEKALRKGGITSATEFERLADVVSRIGDPAKQIAFVMEKLGRSGAMLIPLLRSGATGVRTLREEAKRLGLSFNIKAVEKAEELGDKLAIVFAQLKKVMFEIGAALEPVLTPLVDGLGSILSGLSKWIKENPVAVQQIAKAIGGIAAAGLALVVVGGTLQFIAATLASIAALGGAVGLVMAGISSAAAAMANPVGLGIAAGVGGGVFAVGKIAKWKDALMTMIGVVKDGWTGLVRAFKAGDLENAVRVITLSIETLWLILMQKMKTLIKDLSEFAATTFGTMAATGLETVLFFKEQLPPMLGGGKTDQLARATAHADLRKIFGIGKETTPIEEDPRIQKKLLELQRLLGVLYDLPPAKAILAAKTTSFLDDFEDMAKSKRVDTGGIFSPFAVRSIGGDNWQRMTAQATSETAKNTRKLSLLTWH